MPQTVTLISQICILCGDEDSANNGRVIFWRPGQLPLHNNCRRCGSHSLVPEVNRFRVRPIEHLDPIEKPKMGRPSNKDRAARLLREASHG